VSAFQIFPAIDLLDGKAVRLTKGLRETAEVVGEPFALAAQFAAAAMLHVVDLDGAFAGKLSQTELVGRLCKVHAVQCGGGVRSLDDVTRLLDVGVHRVVVGTAILTQPALLRQCLDAHGPNKLVVAVDVKDGFVAAAGWTETSLVRPDAFARTLAAEGVKHILCTAVHRDGTLEGPDLDVLHSVQQGGLEVIASGGIGSLDDVRAVKRFAGVVIGKAIYAGRFTLDEALSC
jgi:phosphoribosylformimino-5-aminoimidazole carboxamide ribotide isomerase